LEKSGEEKVINELVKKDLNKNSAIQSILTIKSAKPSDNLKEIIKLSVTLGVPSDDIIFSPTLARGLDYYTGMIFEVVLPGYSVGSCGGGGRYDKLIEQLGGANIPAVGIAFGFDRMVEAAEYFKLIPQENIGSQVLVTVFSQNLISQSLKVAQLLRNNKIKTEVYPSLEKLDKQLKYANKKNVPYVIILGPDEVKNNQVVLKDMKTGEQKELNQQKLLEILRDK